MEGIAITFALIALIVCLAWVTGPKKPPKPVAPKPVIRVQEPVGRDFVTWVKTGLCPDCGSTQWYEGPAAGMCVNYQCAGCGAEFNVGFVPGDTQIQRIKVKADDEQRTHS